VRKDQILAELDEPGLQQELDAALARDAQARASLQVLQAGGRSSDIAEIDGSVKRLKSDRDAAQRNLDALQRLLEKQAATAYETEQAKQAVKSLDVQIQALQERRAALVGKSDLSGGQARVEEAEANVRLSRDRITQDVIRAPMAGTIYDLPARAGSFLNAGDPVASIGKLDPVRVRVYVDEPELGRVTPGQSVRITWDALPGKEWTGMVEKRPTEVIALGSRQVGEVLCTIGNPMRELVPGTNVNAFILTQVVENALTIPKGAVRRDGTTGVFLLRKDNTLKWQPITTGASDALRVEVLKGLSDGDAVAQPSDLTLKDGEQVTASF
jgi:HlyD family secretion protein